MPKLYWHFEKNDYNFVIRSIKKGHKFGNFHTKNNFFEVFALHTKAQNTCTYEVHFFLWCVKSTHSKHQAHRKNKHGIRACASKVHKKVRARTYFESLLLYLKNDIRAKFFFPSVTCRRRRRGYLSHLRQLDVLCTQKFGFKYP